MTHENIFGNSYGPASEILSNFMSDSEKKIDLCVFIAYVNFCSQLHMRWIEVISVKTYVKIYMLLYIFIFYPHIMLAHFLSIQVYKLIAENEKI